MRRELRRAMQSPERWVCRIQYQGKTKTERCISPIRFVGKHVVLAMCLGRQEPRQFRIDMIQSLELVPANEVLMPEPIKTIETDK